MRDIGCGCGKVARFSRIRCLVPIETIVNDGLKSKQTKEEEKKCLLKVKEKGDLQMCSKRSSLEGHGMEE
jgi:hypothetical protein